MIADIPSVHITVPDAVDAAEPELMQRRGISLYLRIASVSNANCRHPYANNEIEFALFSSTFLAQTPLLAGAR